MDYIFIRDFEILLVYSPSQINRDLLANYICKFSYDGIGSNLRRAFRNYLDEVGFDYIIIDHLPIIQNLDIHCTYEEVTCDPEYDF